MGQGRRFAYLVEFADTANLVAVEAGAIGFGVKSGQLYHKSSAGVESMLLHAGLVSKNYLPVKTSTGWGNSVVYSNSAANAIDSFVIQRKSDSFGVFTVDTLSDTRYARIGINCAPSGAALHIRTFTLTGDLGAGTTQTQETISNGAGGAALLFRKSRGWLNDQKDVNADDIIGGMVGQVYNGTGYSAALVGLRFLVEGKHGSVAPYTYSTSMRFETSIEGTQTEKMRLTAAGFLGINTTTPSERLHVVGNARIEGNLGVRVTTATARIHVLGGEDEGEAPLKFDPASIVLKNIERGAMEYNGYSLYFTPYDVRRAFTMAGDVLISTVTLQNTTTETAIYSTSLSELEIAPEKIYRIRLSGNISIKSGHVFSAKLFLNSLSYITASCTADRTYTDSHIEIYAQITVRSFSTVWNLSLELGLRIQGMEEVRYCINNTMPNGYDPYLLIKAVWGTADADNVLEIEQGYMEVLN